MFKNRKVVIPTPQEDEAIYRGIAVDPDSYELSAEEIREMKPVNIRNRGGRPRLANPKESVTIRYDAEILAAFRASGEGWQTRMNDALKDWLRTHRP